MRLRLLLVLIGLEFLGCIKIPLQLENRVAGINLLEQVKSTLKGLLSNKSGYTGCDAAFAEALNGALEADCVPNTLRFTCSNVSASVDLSALIEQAVVQANVDEVLAFKVPTLPSDTACKRRFLSPDKTEIAFIYLRINDAAGLTLPPTEVYVSDENIDTTQSSSKVLAQLIANGKAQIVGTFESTTVNNALVYGLAPSGEAQINFENKVFGNKATVFAKFSIAKLLQSFTQGTCLKIPKTSLSLDLGVNPVITVTPADLDCAAELAGG